MAPVTFTERPLQFGCGGEELIGILAEPPSPRTVGLLIVVGGPQYRVGSHRQFVLLARRLAAEAVAALRFDYRGMGDATGPARSFDDVSPDIAAAIDALCEACPDVKRVVLWGLCDAASAALVYWRATRDARIAGMVLVNPWVRSEAGIARTRIRHYYGQHLLEREFWSRLARGRVDLVGTVRDFVGNLFAVAANGGRRAPTGAPTFQDRMSDGLQTFAGPILLILSGRDLTANEFVDYARASPRWTGLLQRPNVTRHDIRDADHTFSSAPWRDEVEARTRDWLRQCFSRSSR